MPGSRSGSRPTGGAVVGDALFRRTEDGYRVSFVDSELEYLVERLRWDRHELFGQLTVACGLAGARTVDGIVSTGSFNLSSTRTRRERAKEIQERIRTNGKVDVLGQL